MAEVGWLATSQQTPANLSEPAVWSLNTMQAAFAEVDITPPLGTRKIGWLKLLVADRVLDPLFARVAIIASAGTQIAFVQLDTLCVRWTQTADIRQRVEERYGFPGGNIMVAATHNHAGPAVATVGDVERDDAYVETLVAKVVETFGRALDGLVEAELGFGSGFEFNVAHNRRVIMRDGTVRTHGRFSDPLALCMEGPIDPEVAVMAARKRDGELSGTIVNFACHPTHHGGDTALSAGYPGALAAEMKSRGCPITLFLNGASGNLHTSDPTRNGADKSSDEVGRILADDVSHILEKMEFRGEVKLGASSRTVQLPFRKITEDEIRGTEKGAQRFVDPAIYDRTIPALVEQIRRRGTQPAEVQVLAIDEYAYVGIPAEYFVEHGLRIKEQAHPRRALVVTHANGMVGYVPHKEAFLRGGYETTFGVGSKLAPEAGDLLADAAIELVSTTTARSPAFRRFCSLHRLKAELQA